MATAYFFDPSFLDHADPAGGHPESPARLSGICDILASHGALDAMIHLPAAPVSEATLTAVQDPRYVETVRQVSARGGSLDGETYIARGSYEIALLAAGAVVNAVDAVMARQVDNAIALVRPPGHHAHPSWGEGFCLFNNIAIAARHAQNRHGLARVLIVDFDVHHGNGTQFVFWEDPHVLYFSTHEWGIYPGSGHPRQIGEGAGAGFTANVPLQAYVGDEGYGRIFREFLRPLAERYRPEFILVSAGYDAHWRDPLAMMALSVTGYADLSHQLAALASDLCEGRLVFVLEGGYDLQALGYGVLASARALLADARPVEDPLGTLKRHEPSVEGVLNELKTIHGLDRVG